ncbi:MAG: ABC transporter permease [Anaerolineae bacterium]|jgi:peptide/nickel transport system permease protein|nr:MAG: ABC transporter permease [Anaerolineae bacterium]
MNLEITKPSKLWIQSVKTRAGVLNRRRQTLVLIVLCVACLVVILAGSNQAAIANQTNLSHRNQAPSWSHPFGTDWLGRDMLVRTWSGLSLSLRVGFLAALFSSIIGLGVGLIAATMGGKIDAFFSWWIDVFLSLPHMVVLILLAFVSGGGLRGVVISVALTHWPSLARVIRAEVYQVRSADYVRLSAKLGHSPFWIARHHILPHVLPQFLVGLILLFPHAILHEAGITFIGIGLSPHQPAIGIILAESMRHLSTGYWWLAALPGAALLAMVKVFDILGENVRALLDPRTAQE